MTPHRKYLFEYKGLESNIEVTIVDGKKLLVKGSGTVKLPIRTGRAFARLKFSLSQGLTEDYCQLVNLRDVV